MSNEFTESQEAQNEPPRGQFRRLHFLPIEDKSTVLLSTVKGPAAPADTPGGSRKAISRKLRAVQERSLALLATLKVPAAGAASAGEGKKEKSRKHLATQESPDGVEIESINTLSLSAVQKSSGEDDIETLNTDSSTVQKAADDAEVELLSTVHLSTVQNLTNDETIDLLSTVPLSAIKGASQRQEQSQPSLQKEVTGAAGAAGLVGIGNIIGSVLKYGSTFLIQYSLGPGLYGLFTLSFSLINLISAIFSLGLDDAMTRYVAIYRGRQRASKLQGLMITCTIIAGIAGIVGALLLLLFTPSLVAFWSSLRPAQAASNRGTLRQMVPLLQLMAPMIPLLCMQVVWFGGLRGFKAFKWSVLTTSILQPIAQILLIFVSIRLFERVAGVALAMLLSTVITTSLYLYWLFREYARVAQPEPGEYELREWLVFSSLNFLTTIVETVLDSIDTLLLAFFGISKVAIGQYGAAIKFGPFITMPLGTFNTIFAPTIAELHSRGEKQKLEEMFKIVTKWSITFSIPIFLVVVLFSPYLLALSGRGYLDAWPLVIAFSVGSLFGAGTGAVGAMLLMTGYNKLSFLNSIVAVVVNLVLGLLLTPRYGAMGTAISTGIAICVNNVMRLTQVRFFLKMHPYRWDTLKPLGAGLLSGIAIEGLLYLLHHAHVHSVFLIGHAVISLELGLIPVFLALYAGLIFLFRMSPEDEVVLQTLRQKFLRRKTARKAA